MTHTTESLMELADAYGKLLAYHATDDYMVCDDGKTRFALQSAIAELVAERDALAKDAARYLWLRNRAVDWYVGPSYKTYNDVVCDGEYRDLAGGGIALDSNIDAAMKETP